MERKIMNTEDMILSGLDVGGDIIKGPNGEPIFVISEDHASSIMKEIKKEK